MNKLILMVLVFFFFLNFLGSNILAQPSSELIQSGLRHYNNGDYENALSSFNNALMQSQQLEPLTGDSEEKDASDSDETKDSASEENYAGSSKEEYEQVSQESILNQSTEKYISEPMEHQGTDQSSIYLYRGRTYMQMGNKEAALSDCDKAIQLNPAAADAYFRRALTNAKVNPDKVCPDLLNAISNGHESAKELYDLICK